jgi:hypothetical protein
MIGSSTIFSIIIGLIIIVLLGRIFYTMYDDMTIVHWILQTIIAGVIVISLVARVGIVDYNDTKVEKSIENTITANYDNITNYHNDENNKTFISSNSKYTFEYNEGTKTLVVLKGSGVDAVFVNGVKQDSQNTSDKTDKNKDCISYKTDDTDEINSKSNADNNSSSTAVSLQQKIQDKIQSRYSDAVITGFDTIKMSGTFSCDNVQYNFQWKDDMLKVINADDADDVTYYKVAQ